MLASSQSYIPKQTHVVWATHKYQVIVSHTIAQKPRKLKSAVTNHHLDGAWGVRVYMLPIFERLDQRVKGNEIAETVHHPQNRHTSRVAAPQVCMWNPILN